MLSSTPLASALEGSHSTGALSQAAVPSLKRTAFQDCRWYAHTEGGKGQRWHQRITDDIMTAL